MPLALLPVAASRALFLGLLFLFALLLSGAVQAAGASDLVAVGQLRLQSQRVAKLYLQAGLQIQADSARNQ